MQRIFKDVLADLFCRSISPAIREVGRHGCLVCDLYRFLVQGAPETIQERLANVPGNYVEIYKQYTRQGARVLALAYKILPDMAVSSQSLTVDLQLIFIGMDTVYNHTTVLLCLEL